MEVAPLLGWIGSVVSLLLFAAPTPTFLRIARRGSVGGFDATPYLVSLLQCMLWISYAAVTPDRLSILVTNSCGAAMQLFWCCLFLRFSPRKRWLAAQIFAVVAVWLVTTLFGVLCVDHLGLRPRGLAEATLQTQAIGAACALLNTLMYASPLAVAQRVIRTRSVENMPLPLSLMTFLTSSCWLAYGTLERDLWITIPNAFGVSFGLAQLAIYAVYCNEEGSAQEQQLLQEVKTNKEEEEEEKAEQGLAAVAASCWRRRSRAGG